MIIKILYENEELSSGELKKQLDLSLLKHGYKKTAPDTYWGRLRQLSSSSNNKQSKYVIHPVLQKRDEGRGKNVFYSLTKDAKIRWDLKLPIMKVEEYIEKGHRLLFYYMIFSYNQTKKLKDENEFNAFLEKTHIKKNELKFSGTAAFKGFKITKCTHPESEIEFTLKNYLQPSGKEGKFEYFCMLPGISPSDYRKIREHGLIYQQLDFTQNEVMQFFKLLENQKLIMKIKLKELEYLNEERYTIADNSLKDILLECWALYNHVFTYLIYIWQGIRRPKDEERIWLKHLWGKSRSEEWFRHCYHIRREYKEKNKNQVLKETKERLDWEKSEIIKKFSLINNKYAKTINDYSFFINPLLNVVYPRFLRKDIETI